MLQSPIKTEDKGKSAETTEDGLVETKEVEVTSLPKPDPMPVDDDGEIIDTRIPIVINPPKKTATLDILINQNQVRKKKIRKFSINLI